MSAGSDSSHSFTDLMTSLAVIFILLLVATLNNAFSESDQAMKDLRKEVAEELKKINLTITEDPTDPYTQIINLDEEKVKFDFLAATLKPEGRDLVRHLFGILIPKLCDEKLRSKIESVIVEGHTDSIGNRSTEGKVQNIKLSQDRAYTVLHTAFTELKSVSEPEIDCLRSLALATGRGSSRLRSSDSASRRVEIKIRVKSGFAVANLVNEEAQ
ncbi:MAG: hypothetical protein AB7H97_10225 [Pseudobdellovibrionaceae bacterium]